MKKIERSKVFIESHLDLFRCPICKTDFTQVENNGIHCENHHSFNISKKGTVHFLDGAASDQYDQDLFEARLTIGKLGLWQPIIDFISDHFIDGREVTLDIGCGNGYHLNALKEQNPSLTSIGFDISKPGIEMAAKYFTESFWCIADLAQAPFADHAFDLLLNLFTPSNYSEFDRLLKEGGKVVKVVPNANYLVELRVLSDKTSPYSNEAVIENFKSEFPNCDHHNLTYKVPVPEDRIDDLLEMTPLGWQEDKAELAEILKSIKNFQVSVDVSVLMGKKELA